MKLIVTSTGKNLESMFDLRFGRSAWFCVFDTETNAVEFIENSNKNNNSGAGTKAAEMAAELKADKVISGDFGPKAKSLLEEFKIQMIILEERKKTIQEIIETLKN